MAIDPRLPAKEMPFIANVVTNRPLHIVVGARGDTALQVRRSRVRFPMVCHWNVSLTQSFGPHYGPGVDSGSKINEYQEFFLWVKAAGA